MTKLQPLSASPEIAGPLYERLRRQASPSSVPGSLPVLFFGDLLSSRVATVGLNPSPHEFTDRQGRELDGAQRRFETLSSLGAESRADLSDEQCNWAIDTMRGYIDAGRPAYSWFNSLGRVLAGMGVSYALRQACHLDLVQESTDPTWSRLSAGRPEEAGALLRQDLPFLHWEIASFPIDIVICNGRSVLDTVIAELGASVTAYEKPSRFAWTVAIADMDTRRVGVAGWNIPLARPTGMTSQDQVELGTLFLERLDSHGVVLSE